MLCADEKSQIQALDRTQPGLPMKKGRCGTMTHDYKRNGTATLFAAMNTLDGTVISMCDDRHRHQEWLKFLTRDRRRHTRRPAKISPDRRQLRHAQASQGAEGGWLAIRASTCTSRRPAVRGSTWWSASFATSRRTELRRGIFRDVEELIMAIGDYIDKHNDNPKPFVWTAKAADILEKVKRARKVLDNG